MIELDKHQITLIGAHHKKGTRYELECEYEKGGVLLPSLEIYNDAFDDPLQIILSEFGCRIISEATLTYTEAYQIIRYGRVLKKHETWDPAPDVRDVEELHELMAEVVIKKVSTVQIFIANSNLHCNLVFSSKNYKHTARSEPVGDPHMKLEHYFDLIPENIARRRRRMVSTR